jgi:2-polyprenyl-6-methoxyphenol hydroxylase-like FAD-dependent oxidoreductase
MIVDVAIVGGGPVGASLARALAPSGLSIALVESRVHGRSRLKVSTGGCTR